MLLLPLSSRLVAGFVQHDGDVLMCTHGCGCMHMGTSDCLVLVGSNHAES